jgi:5-methylthioribose kinase
LIGDLPRRADTSGSRMQRPPDRTARSPQSNDAGDGTCTETPLDGGVSSDIRVVHSPQGSYVVKCALEKLRVRADWFSDRARSSIEARALGAIATLIGPAHVPAVLWIDEIGHRFAMERIDDRFENWKQRLLRGQVDLATARVAGRLLGRLHARSAADAALARAFDNVQPFVELRIRPYFERVAQKNPSLAPAIADVVEQIMTRRHALVHGDYSPKNLLVDGEEVVILDCEVAHWGDARFDVAFCVAHLLLKSLRGAAPAALLRDAALVFLADYRAAGPAPLDRDFGRQLGCLLLARLEGDSPVDYLKDLDTAAIKRFATALLLHPPADAESCVRASAGVAA